MKTNKGYSPGTELLFEHVITHKESNKHIPFDSVDRIWDAFIAAVEKEGLSTSGGVRPSNMDVDDE